MSSPQQEQEAPSDRDIEAMSEERKTGIPPEVIGSIGDNPESGGDEEFDGQHTTSLDIPEKVSFRTMSAMVGISL